MNCSTRHLSKRSKAVDNPGVTRDKKQQASAFRRVPFSYLSGDSGLFLLSGAMAVMLSPVIRFRKRKMFKSFRNIFAEAPAALIFIL